MRQIASTLSRLLMCIVVFGSIASAQLLNEDFNYPAGDTLTSHGWLVSSGGTTNAILTTSPGLAFNYYVSSGIGNAATLTTTGQDVYRSFVADSVGSVYASLMVNVTSVQATGDYFLGLSPSTLQTNYYARLFIKSTTGGYLLGISKSNETPQSYGATVFSLGTTYLVVLKYTFNTGSTTDDAISLYVIPTLSAPLTVEPVTPEVGPYTNATKVDASNLGFLTLRQGTASNAPGLIIDGIRVDSTWNGALGNPASLIYSVGTGNVPGEQGHFTSLKAAFDSLSHGFVFSGNSTFYVTSDITEPEIGGLGLGLACDPTPYTVTFKPYTGVTPTVTLQYPSDGNSGPSGACLIGMNGPTMAWADLKPTRNIEIDGSNTKGGTTRDLTIQTTGAVRNAFPLVIVGDASGITVKNCNIYYGVTPPASTSGNLLVSALVIRSATVANTGTVEKIPSNITIDNNNISSNFSGAVQAAQGLGGYASAAPAVVPSNITVRNNKIEGKRRAISLYLLGSTDIYSNEIVLNQSVADGLTNEAIAGLSTGATSTYNIYNNRISSVASINSTAATTGLAGISIEGAGTFNVYNNMIYGFALNSVNANKSAYVYGIKNSSATATVNIFFNSIQMDDLASIGTGIVNYRGIFVANGTNTVENNIIVNNEDDFASFNIYRPNSGTPGVFNGTLTSDYNDFYRSGTTNAQIGFYDAANAADLAAWKSASVQDANSVSGAAQFVSATDLHIDPTANPVSAASDVGTPLAVTMDIDGDLRNATHPDMGADEFVANPAVKGPLFTATPSSLDFQTVLLYRSKTDSVTVKNTGTDSLIITNVVSTDSSFTVAPTEARLDSMATQKFYITFSPKAVGKKVAAIVFTSNVTEVTDSVKVSGSGTTVASIAEARKDDNHDLIADHSVTKDTLVVNGIITSPNFQASGGQTAYFIQDSTAGIEVFFFGLGATNFAIGDSVIVVGTVSQYRGLTELIPLTLDSSNFGVLKHGAVVPKPTRLTLHTFVTNAESYEGQLIEIDTLYKAYGTWPTASANASVYLTNLSRTDTAQMFIDLDTDIDGTTEPAYPVNVVGVASQYSSGSTVYNNGYEIIPRDTTDIKHIIVIGVNDLSTGIPKTYELQNNYPNPFNPTTTIKFGLPVVSKVALTIYDILGKEVATIIKGELPAGYYAVPFNAVNLASGVYFYRIVATSVSDQGHSFMQTRKLILMK